MKIFCIILVVLFCLLQYKLWIAGDGVAETIQLKKTVVVQARDNDQLEKQNQTLVSEIQDLKTGKTAIESLARENLGFIKPDETYYRIVDQM